MLSFGKVIFLLKKKEFLTDGRTDGRQFNHFSYDKPIGASPRRDEDGTILACSTYSTYTVRIGIKKGGERSAGYG